MKKIFRLASVFAVAGVTLLYSGCTKDYDVDIKAVKDDLAALQSGTVATQSQQIAALQEQVGTLQGLAAQMNSALENLNKVKADKSAVDSAIENLNNAKADKTALKEASDNIQKALDDAKSELQNQIAAINNSIDDLKAVVDKKADKSWVEATFATQEAAAALETRLGAAESSIKDINGKISSIIGDIDALGRDLGAKISGLQGDIETINANLEKMGDDIKDAASKASKALNDIEVLRTDLAANYYKSGEIDGMIKAAKKELQDQIDKLQKDVDAAATKTELNQKVADLEKTLKNLFDEKLATKEDKGTAEKLISALEKELKAAIDLKESKEDAATKKAELEGKINELRTDLTAIINTKQSIEDAAKVKEELEGAIADLEEEKDGLKERIAELEAKSATKDEVKNLQDQIDQINKEIQKLQEEKQSKADAEAMKEELEGEISVLDGKISDLEKEKAELKKRVSDLELNSATKDEVAAEVKNLQDQIDQINKEIQKLQEEKQSKADAEKMQQELEGEISVLDGKISDLEKEKDELKKRVSDLELNSATKDEVAAEVKKLQDQIDQIDKDIEGINKDIKALQNDKQSKADAEKMQQELEKLISDNIDVVKGMIEDLDAKKADKNRVEEIKDSLQNQINALSDKSDSLSQVTLALGAKIKEETAAIGARIDGVETAYMNADKALNERIEKLHALHNMDCQDIVRGLNAKDEKIKEAFAAADADILLKLAEGDAANNAKIDSVITVLENNYSALKDSIADNKSAILANKSSIENEIDRAKVAEGELMQLIKDNQIAISKLSNKVMGIATRLTSISVLPTQIPELYEFKAGDTATYVLAARFQVEPSIYASQIKAEDVKLYLSEALPRYSTRGEIEEPSPAYYSVSGEDIVLEADEINGVISVRTNKIKQPNNVAFSRAPRVNLLYFALEYNGEDKEVEDEAFDSAKAYSVISSYEPAITKSVNLINNIVIFDGEKVVNGKYNHHGPRIIQLDTAYIDYSLAADTTETPFATYSLRYLMDDELFTLDEVSEYTGVEFEVDSIVRSFTKYAPNAQKDNDKLRTTTDDDKSFDTEVSFQDTANIGYKMYVGEITTEYYRPAVNGAAINTAILKPYEIILHPVCNDSLTLNIYWNYKNYDKGKSNTIQYVEGGSDWWSKSIDSLALYVGGKTTVLKFTPSATSVFNLGPNSDPAYYNSSLYANKKSNTLPFKEHPVTYQSDKLVKENDHDRYTFYLTVNVDSLPSDTLREFTLEDSIPVTISKANKIGFDKISASFLKDAEDEVLEYLIKGLGDDYNYADIKAAFEADDFKIVKFENIAESGAVAIANDQMSIDEVKGNDSIYFNFKKNVLLPESVYKVTLMKTVFDRNYYAIFNFTTAQPLLRLKTMPVVHEGEEAKFDGDIFNSKKSAQVYGKVNLDFKNKGEGVDADRYSMIDMYVRQYLRLESTMTADIEEVLDSCKVYYEFTYPNKENSPFEKDPSRKFKEVLDSVEYSTVSRDEKTGEIVFPENDRFEWNHFQGRQVQLKATLKIDDVAVSTETFTLWTMPMVELAQAAEIHAKRLVAEDLTLNLSGMENEGATCYETKIFGMYQGRYNDALNILKPDSWVFECYRPNNYTKLTYSVESATINGVETVLVENTDYTLDNENGTITILKNNVQDPMVIKVKLDLTYYLDYAHSTEDGGIITDYVMIYLNEK